MNPVDQPYQADIFVTADRLDALNQLEQALRRDTTFLKLVSQVRILPGALFLPRFLQIGPSRPFHILQVCDSF